MDRQVTPASKENVGTESAETRAVISVRQNDQTYQTSLIYLKNINIQTYQPSNLAGNRSSL
jgi:hypothetical protein